MCYTSDSVPQLIVQVDPPRRTLDWQDCSRLPLALLVIGAVLGSEIACYKNEAVALKPQLVIATGRQYRDFDLIGQALAQVYAKEIPEVRFSTVPTGGSVFNVRALENGQVQMAFAQSDVAYFAFKQGTSNDSRPYTALRAVAALYVSAIHVVVSRTSKIRTLDDLRGKRIATGESTSGDAIASNVILEAQGLKNDVIPEGVGLENETARFQAGELDAGFAVMSYPVPAIARLNSDVGIRLLEIDPEIAARIRSRHPFFRPTVIPERTYEGQGSDVKTLGVDNLLLCRADLPADLVQRLTRAFIESLGTLSHIHRAIASIDEEQASTTAIPLHPGAALYYRERELFR